MAASELQLTPRLARAKMNSDRKAQLKKRLHDALLHIRRRVPRGLRFVLGLMLIVGGIFGFLPVLGFWMIPLGVMVASFDVRLALRWWRQKRSQNHKR
ncbi:MAG: hypothetical protein AB7S99_15035 [Pseudodonghicola sp.]